MTLQKASCLITFCRFKVERSKGNVKKGTELHPSQVQELGSLAWEEEFYFPFFTIPEDHAPTPLLKLEVLFS
jgi:hypothetical protein